MDIVDGGRVEFTSNGFAQVIKENPMNKPFTRIIESPESADRESEDVRDEGTWRKRIR